MSVIPDVWQAEPGEAQVQGQLQQFSETQSQNKVRHRDVA
jgi:hypothetical protein